MMMMKSFQQITLVVKELNLVMYIIRVHAPSGMGIAGSDVFSLLDPHDKPTWVKVFRINLEFRILRLTFHRKSASKC